MKLILGTVQFGFNYGINNATGKPTEKEIFEMLDYAFEHGVEKLDTADAYGNASHILGLYNQKKQRRCRINTKFKMNNLTLADQLEASLRSLSLMQIDTYFFHSYEDFIRNPHRMFELKVLKNAKRINRIGISVYNNLEVKSAIDSPEIDVIQLPFNLLDNIYQRGTLLKEAKRSGKEIQVRSVFLQGLFFKALNEIPLKLTPLIPYLKEIQSIAAKFNTTIEHLALQYAIQQPDIDYIIFGIDNLEQLKRNLAYSMKSIPKDAMERIDEIHISETELLYPKNWN